MSQLFQHLSKRRHDSRVRRLVGFVVGVLLIAAAVFAVVRQDGLAQSLTALREASPGLVVLLVLLCISVPVLSGVIFWLMNNRYGRVGLGEMVALIGSAWLLNYLPMRPGMFGRIAYHKKVNDIAVVDSVKVLVWVNVLSLLSAGVLIAILLGGLLFVESDSSWIAVLAAMPIPLIFCFGLYARARRPEPDPEVWRLVMAFVVRYGEMHVWAGRYAVSFALIGQPIPWSVALALSSAATFAWMIPLAGNGLGAREWTIGLVIDWLPRSFTKMAAEARTIGLAADLLNRAVELLVAIPFGLIAAAMLSRRIRARGGLRELEVEAVQIEEKLEGDGATSP